ncbi:unnamed protein product [Symbiodinium sp. CCMP2592]|nr:unnamed protein product [Symbiodinium sp. CCMP2592]
MFHTGDVVYVDYGERPICVHTRVVLAVVDHGSHEYVVLTPDYDVFTEILHESNPDFTRFMLPGPHGGIPRGVSARNVYAFAPMSAADLANYTQQGRAEAEAEILRRGAAAAGVGDADPGPMVGAPEIADGRRWVLAEYVPGHKIGEEVELSSGAARDGDWAIHRVPDLSGTVHNVLVSRVADADLESFCEARIHRCREAEAADHFLQTGYRPGGAIVVPALTKHVADKLHQEGQILKERRKLREEKGIGKGKTKNPGGNKVFQPPRPRDERQRDLFPLPLLVEEPEVAKKRLNSAVVALNSLFFGKEIHSAKTCISISDLPQGQGDVLRSLIHRLGSLGPPPAGACYREALQALQVPGGSYEAEPGVGDTVPMDLSLLSLPTLKGTGVDLESEMTGDVGEMIRDFEGYLLQDASAWASVAEEAARMKPYNDPKMRHRGFYREFLLRLQGCGILTFSHRARGRVGAFTVSKKPKVIDGQRFLRQRLILDCRQVNFQFRPPPLTELGSLAALCEIEIGQGETMYIGGADIADCFYGCRLPAGMESFFCFKEDLTVKEARALFQDLPEWVNDLDEHSIVSPCLSVLPMGFSWSFYIVQQLHEQITMQALSLDHRDLVLDAHPARDFRSASVFEKGVFKFMKRCGMSIFRSLYDFSTKGNLRREWTTRVTCTDASPEGFGIVECELGVDQVKEIGRWNERWRFKRLPVSEWRPRERAFNYDIASDLFTAERPGPPHGVNQEYVANDDFVEVPFALMQPERWHTAKVGMWKDTSEHISLKEGRCFILALRRLARDSKQRGKKVLILVDNLALGMAISKGRAHDFHILRICQQAAAISLAADFFVRPRWVPSEVNPADGGLKRNRSETERRVITTKAPLVSSSRPGIGRPRMAIAEVKRDSRVLTGTIAAIPAGRGKKVRAKTSSRVVKGRLSSTPTTAVERMVKLGKEKAAKSEEEADHDMTLLEMASVSEAQRNQYSKYLISFKDFCKEHVKEWPPEDLDWMLADFFDDMFLEGSSLAVGEKTLAAVEFRFVHSKKGLLRARRALKGWRKMRPPTSRLPLPKPVAFGIATVMIARGFKDMAIKVLVDFDLYLRPGESFDVRAKHVVRPIPRSGKQYQKFAVIIRDQDMGKPDKTGTFDNTILLDNPTTESWLGPHLCRLAKKVTEDSPVFQFTPEEFRKQFQSAAEALGLKHLHPYQLRHGGASEDLNSRLRDHIAVRERGRWKTDSSLRRYAKTGKLQKLLGDLKESHLEFCQQSVRRMPKVLDGTLPAQLP